MHARGALAIARDDFFLKQESPLALSERSGRAKGKTSSLCIVKTVLSDRLFLIDVVLLYYFEQTSSAHPTADTHGHDGILDAAPLALQQGGADQPCT